MCFSLSISSKYHALVLSYLSNIVVPPEDLTLLSFNSVTHYFGSQLESWPNGIVNHYILETDMLHYPITIHLPSRFTVQFKTLSHFIIISTDFIIIEIISLLLVPALNIVLIVCIVFLMGIKLVITMITMIL